MFSSDAPKFGLTAGFTFASVGAARGLRIDGDASSAMVQGGGDEGSLQPGFATDKCKSVSRSWVLGNDRREEGLTQTGWLSWFGVGTYRYPVRFGKGEVLYFGYKSFERCLPKKGEFDVKIGTTLFLTGNFNIPKQSKFFMTQGKAVTLCTDLGNWFVGLHPAVQNHIMKCLKSDMKIVDDKSTQNKVTVTQGDTNVNFKI